LVITNEETDELFNYHLNPSGKPITALQELQETLFHEKVTIIENCLFGVDINPNSVNICRLRLWIELLKNSYYTKESNYTELETLPNIDINIKQGNSLVSRFDIKQDIFSVADRKTLEIYKLNVSLYKNEQDRNKRRELKKSIETIKERIKGFSIDPLKKEHEQIEKLTEKLHKLNSESLFDREISKEERLKIEKKRNDLIAKINKLKERKNKKAEEYRAIYSNAFEWRFEFPEVLDNVGNFNGFDVIIGNPPYIYNRDLHNNMRDFYKEKYNMTDDLYAYFSIEALKLLKRNAYLCFITPNTFLTLSTKEQYRKEILKYRILSMIYSGFCFIDAYVETMITILKHKVNAYNQIAFLSIDNKGVISEKVLCNQKLYEKNYLARFYKPNALNYKIAENINKELQTVFNDFKYTLLGRKNKKEARLIQEYNSKLNAGEFTCLGLITKGDQGLVTGNNSKYLAKIINFKDEEKVVLNKLYNEIIKYKKLKFVNDSLIDKKKELFKVAEKLKMEKDNPSLFGRFFLYKCVEKSKVNDYSSLTFDEKLNGKKYNNEFWIKYNRGNNEGYRWIAPSKEAIDWSLNSVKELKEGEVTNSRWQGHNYFNTTGFAWVDYFTDKIKAFFVTPGPYSKSIVKLHSFNKLPDLFIVCLLNSKFISYYVKNFITSTHTLQINDGRLIPIKIPTEEQLNKFISKGEKIINKLSKNIDADIEDLELEVDRLVYDLYELTEDEIKIVEESF